MKVLVLKKIALRANQRDGPAAPNIFTLCEAQDAMHLPLGLFRQRANLIHLIQEVPRVCRVFDTWKMVEDMMLSPMCMPCGAPHPLTSRTTQMITDDHTCCMMLHAKVMLTKLLVPGNSTLARVQHCLAAQPAEQLQYNPGRFQSDQ